MYGFTIIYNNTKGFEIDVKQKIIFTHPTSSHIVSFFYNQSNKFKKDKLFDENESFIVGIDGVILNLNEIKNTYGISNYFDLVVHLYQENQFSFFEQFRGNFSGFIFDKKTEQLICFTDHNASGKLYYTQVENSTIISPTLQTISEFKGASNSLINVLFSYMPP